MYIIRPNNTENTFKTNVLRKAYVDNIITTYDLINQMLFSHTYETFYNPETMETDYKVSIVRFIYQVALNLTATPSSINVGESSSLIATGYNNCKIRWYDALTGGNLLATKDSLESFVVSPSVTTTYYADLYDPITGYVAKQRKKLTVTVTIVLPVLSVVSNPETINIGSSSVLYGITPTPNSVIRFYDAATGGNLINTTPSGQGYSVSPNITTTYYIEAYNTVTQLSSARLSVLITVIQLPVLDAYSGPSTIFVGGAVDLGGLSSSPNTVIRFFNTETLGNLLNTINSGESWHVSPVITTTYWIESYNTITLLSSARHAIVVTVVPVVVNYQDYASSGSFVWTCPAGVNSVNVECWGGGGKGFNNDVTSHGTSGGGAGAYAKLNNFAVVPGLEYLLYVGAQLENSYFIDLLTLKAVCGNSALVKNVGGLGGSDLNCIGDVKVSGGNGGNGNGISGAGGDAYNGGSGGLGVDIDQVGNIGNAPGGGGSGGGGSFEEFSNLGGDGAVGRVYISW